MCISVFDCILVYACVYICVCIWDCVCMYLRVYVSVHIVFYCLCMHIKTSLVVSVFGYRCFCMRTFLEYFGVIVNMFPWICPLMYVIVLDYVYSVFCIDNCVCMCSYVVVYLYVCVCLGVLINFLLILYIKFYLVCIL